MSLDSEPIKLACYQPRAVNDPPASQILSSLYSANAISGACDCDLDQEVESGGDNITYYNVGAYEFKSSRQIRIKDANPDVCRSIFQIIVDYCIIENMFWAGWARTESANSSISNNVYPRNPFDPSVQQSPRTLRSPGHGCAPALQTTSLMRTTQPSNIRSPTDLRRTGEQTTLTSTSKQSSAVTIFSSDTQSLGSHTSRAGPPQQSSYPPVSSSVSAESSVVALGASEVMIRLIPTPSKGTAASTTVSVSYTTDHQTHPSARDIGYDSLLSFSRASTSSSGIPQDVLSDTHTSNQAGSTSAQNSKNTGPFFSSSMSGGSPGVFSGTISDISTTSQGITTDVQSTSDSSPSFSSSMTGSLMSVSTISDDYNHIGVSSRSSSATSSRAREEQLDPTTIFPTSRISTTQKTGPITIAPDYSVTDAFRAGLTETTVSASNGAVLVYSISTLSDLTTLSNLIPILIYTTIDEIESDGHHTHFIGGVWVGAGGRYWGPPGIPKIETHHGGHGFHVKPPCIWPFCSGHSTDNGGGGGDPGGDPPEPHDPDDDPDDEQKTRKEEKTQEEENTEEEKTKTEEQKTKTKDNESQTKSSQEERSTATSTLKKLSATLTSTGSKSSGFSSKLTAIVTSAPSFSSRVSSSVSVSSRLTSSLFPDNGTVDLPDHDFTAALMNYADALALASSRDSHLGPFPSIPSGPLFGPTDSAESTRTMKSSSFQRNDDRSSITRSYSISQPPATEINASSGCTLTNVPGQCGHAICYEYL
ncbi:hypothetical protein MMC21_006630 [Puttea exsequens]|nr:hypothetical protein [Puttea exsequens]